MLVRGGEEDERPLQPGGIDTSRCLDRQGQVGLHVRGAEAVEPPVGLRQLEGIVTPSLLVVWYRIRVASQHQSA